MKYIIRLVVAPLLFAILFIYSFSDLIKKTCIATYYFIQNGGEILPYSKQDKKTIAAIYDMLTKEIKNKNKAN